MTESIEHGTHQGRNWHNRSGVPACAACREFGRLYQRERRLINGSHRLVTFPLTATIDLGLGATIARSIRESA